MNDENNRDEIVGSNFIMQDSKKEKESDRSNEDFIEKENDSGEMIPEHYYTRENINHKVKSKQKSRFLSYFIVALIAALIGGLISSYIAPMYLYGKIIPVPNYYSGLGNREEIKINPTNEIGAVEAVAKKSMKSVVGITTIEEEEVDYLFWRVPVQRQGLGSGVIINRDGYIITNSHVVADGRAKEITVLFEDGSKKSGEVLWNSVVYDLAVVKVKVSNLPVAELGDSDDLEVGQLAVAIGNPLGLEFQRTVTSGVISGLNRTIVIENNEKIENLIQTDASINPGNSGGPLLNAKGQVIGINTAKIQGGEGLGLSIPINVVKPIIDQIINKGEYKQVYLGISGASIDEYEQALGIDLNADRGLYIYEVIKNSPAYESGMHAGDIILELDNNEVNSINDLKKLLFKYKPGDTGILKILRNGDEINLEITFAEMPDNF
ncbi:serine protease HtrA [Sporosalibacterium faouarense]|uniref:serine protease HtrA n=1 Tax=Sporosalibacterium faouarense TaxID=516123 RepID=UPI00141D456C|nr:trypsin-like peptidase domain-containing protein [Sporosalibacterium faouarense]MTI46247.1 trypsin-like serine protease [Bacillota bacterium]